MPLLAVYEAEPVGNEDKTLIINACMMQIVLLGAAEVSCLRLPVLLAHSSPSTSLSIAGDEDKFSVNVHTVLWVCRHTA